MYSKAVFEHGVYYRKIVNALHSTSKNSTVSKHRQLDKILELENDASLPHKTDS